MASTGEVTLDTNTITRPAAPCRPPHPRRPLRRPRLRRNRRPRAPRPRARPPPSLRPRVADGRTPDRLPRSADAHGRRRRRRRTVEAVPRRRRPPVLPAVVAVAAVAAVAARRADRAHPRRPRIPTGHPGTGHEEVAASSGIGVVAHGPAVPGRGRCRRVPRMEGPGSAGSAPALMVAGVRTALWRGTSIALVLCASLLPGALERRLLARTEPTPDADRSVAGPASSESRRIRRHLARAPAARAPGRHQPSRHRGHQRPGRSGSERRRHGGGPRRTPRWPAGTGSAPVPARTAPRSSSGHVDSVDGAGGLLPPAHPGPGRPGPGAARGRQLGEVSRAVGADLSQRRVPGPAGLRREQRARSLNLVTCGGEYDAARGGYQSNVVVHATWVPDTERLTETVRPCSPWTNTEHPPEHAVSCAG